jgi:signal peptidase II
MTVVALTLLTVLVFDQALKLLVRSGKLASVSLGPFGTLEVGTGRLWAHRLTDIGPNVLWLWVFAACALLPIRTVAPSSSVFIGLMLGGSLSNAVEGTIRGSVTDYVRLRYWPAFNLADAALVVGAIGFSIQVAKAISDATV